MYFFFYFYYIDFLLCYSQIILKTKPCFFLFLLLVEPVVIHAMFQTLVWTWFQKVRKMGGWYDRYSEVECEGSLCGRNTRTEVNMAVIVLKRIQTVPMETEI